MATFLIDVYTIYFGLPVSRGAPFSLHLAENDNLNAMDIVNN